jgi:hypothetical protein
MAQQVLQQSTDHSKSIDALLYLKDKHMLFCKTLKLCSSINRSKEGLSELELEQFESNSAILTASAHAGKPLSTQETVFAGAFGTGGSSELQMTDKVPYRQSQPKPLGSGLSALLSSGKRRLGMKTELAGSSVATRSFTVS